MADLNELQASQSIKIIGSSLTGVETFPANVDANGNLLVKDAADGTVGSAVPTTATQIAGSDGVNLKTIKVDANGGQIIAGEGTPGVPVGGVASIQFAEPQTYTVVASAFVPTATAATDIFSIIGSATKTIRVHKVRASGTTTSGTAIKLNFQLIKRSTVNTGGTSVADTPTAHDSTNAAATATAKHYTANPTALGTSVGLVRAEQASVSVSGQLIEWTFNETSVQALYLRGVAENLCVNLGGASITGPVFTVFVEFSEV